MSIILYIHGQGGSASESDHYKALFLGCEVIGLVYRASTPWEAETEFHEIVENLSSHYDNIILIANSIGAYYSMVAHLDNLVNVAFFISPVVDLEKLSGVELSEEYLRYVRSHPINWNVPTHILYGSNDHLTSIYTIKDFVMKHHTTLTVMDGGEHWFHTDEQMQFLDIWIKKYKDNDPSTL